MNFYLTLTIFSVAAALAGALRSTAFYLVDEHVPDFRPPGAWLKVLAWGAYVVLGALLVSMPVALALAWRMPGSGWIVAFAVASGLVADFWVDRLWRRKLGIKLWYRVGNFWHWC